ncbi:phosphoglycerate dehydrogenase [Deinococcus deserti]|uniref:Putative D-isomer specific 2-hydroxyacid dehydrogenase family, putative phosphoglycerate dehydrogenase (D-3-phosphoglycerate dehydrogenase) n=1 Tax=Deinococcus deserti (strain DSM 17065 / CIP 109153 / LMG 22923 / VCD115) TaxID=546414 RepID=C1D3K3_DEIDV|nr:phosphoglycerate dehydrogenase [Deinococcus deserti]ACO48082.1 putative D-isomer specific 2-hydroxyacid dehydrogenase family, putative phosphoglycerate dehydrogenase (D-3-phosphoglycerate dehydrogenase) [Deinococcus deserti VCD115]
MTQKVLVTSIFLHAGGEVDHLLRAEGFEPTYAPALTKRTEDELIGLLDGVSGAIIANEPFTDRVLAAAPDLKVISRTGVGFDSIDVAAATQRGVVVCNTPNVNRYAVAEWTLAMMLGCARHAVKNWTEMNAGGFKRFEGTELYGKTLGLAGLGGIGKEVARRAHAFGMTLLAVEEYQDQAFAAQYGVTYVDLETALEQSDFLSLHLPLNAQTRHLINAERLARMKPSACLINTARGGVVDTVALAQALREGTIAAAALDVFEEEPLPADSHLHALENLLMSPHVGGVTTEARQMSGVRAAENLILALKGQAPASPVNPEVIPTARYAVSAT